MWNANCQYYNQVRQMYSLSRTRDTVSWSQSGMIYCGGGVVWVGVGKGGMIGSGWSPATDVSLHFSGLSLRRFSDKWSHARRLDQHNQLIHPKGQRYCLRTQIRLAALKTNWKTNRLSFTTMSEDPSILPWLKARWRQEYTYSKALLWNKKLKV